MNGFPKILWHALWNADLISVPEIHSRCIEKFQACGKAERTYLVDRIGLNCWNSILSAWDRPEVEQLAINQLAFGAVMTEFFIAPVSLPQSSHAYVVHMGSLVNLIVGVYDDIIDSGSESDPLPLQALMALSKGQRLPDADAPSLAILAGEYFKQLAAMPCPETHSEIHATLRRAILSMYAAERKTLTGDLSVARRMDWLRKTVLPFVVMALPAWLTMSCVSGPAYRRHLRWIYSCSEFWGWIDDAVDLTEDEIAGHFNSVAETLRSETSSLVAERIARRGHRIMADWRRLTPNAADLPLFVQEALPTCIFSALALSLSQTKKEVNT
jgi:hypothetical protein